MTTLECRIIALPRLLILEKKIHPVLILTPPPPDYYFLGNPSLRPHISSVKSLLIVRSGMAWVKGHSVRMMAYNGIVLLSRHSFFYVDIDFIIKWGKYKWPKRDTVDF